MLTGDATLQPSLARDDAAKLLGQTMGLVAITAGVFALGAYLGRNLSPDWTWLWFIAAIGCLISAPYVRDKVDFPNDQLSRTRGA